MTWAWNKRVPGRLYGQSLVRHIHEAFHTTDAVIAKIARAAFYGQK